MNRLNVGTIGSRKGESLEWSLKSNCFFIKHDKTSISDTNQVHKEMTKDAKVLKEKSSQSRDLTRGRIERMTRASKVLPAGLLNDYKYVVNN